MTVSLHRLTPYFFVLPALALLAVFVYGPAAENVGYSLYSWSSMSAAKRFVGLANYHELLANPIFWRSLLNNTIYAVVSVVFQVGVALVLAAILQAGVFGPLLRSLYRTTLFLPSILPLTIFGAFKVFDIVWVMTAGGPNHASEVLGTHMYRSAFRDDVAGYASAVATVIFLITLAIGAMQIKLQRDH